VKHPACEFNQSPIPSEEVKNEWSYTSAPPICLHGVDRDNFVFKGRVVPVRAMKALRGTGATVILILNVGSKGR